MRHVNEFAGVAPFNFLLEFLGTLRPDFFRGVSYCDQLPCGDTFGDLFPRLSNDFHSDVRTPGGKEFDRRFSAISNSQFWISVF